MRISVVIPTYNSSGFLAKTLDSVLKQTRLPDEILILDDGSTDETVALAKAFDPRITVSQQANKGVAVARNVLSRNAMGDLIAFLDHDDIWHPDYLAVQAGRFQENPQASGFFTKHVNFQSSGGPEWEQDPAVTQTKSEIISPANFVKRYNNSSGLFYSMSFCCVPKRVLQEMGDEPFPEKVTGVDDCYLGNMLPLMGPVIYTPAVLVGYRISSNAQSVNQLKNFKLVVDVFLLLEERYGKLKNAGLKNAFKTAFAGKRRRYGKTLMGVGRVQEARDQFLRSLTQAASPVSVAKSLSLLCLSCAPAKLQPKWPSSQRTSP